MCVGWRQFLLFVTLVFFVTHFLSGYVSHVLLFSFLLNYALESFDHKERCCFVVSVMELHQNSNVKDSHQKKNRKFDHLVFGPAAGEGLPNRLQCKGILRTLKSLKIISWYLQTCYSFVH